MKCEACLAFERSHLSGWYISSCEGCKVRHIAAGPSFWKSLKERRITDAYKAELIASFGRENWEAAHEKVKSFHKSTKQPRG